MKDFAKLSEVKKNALEMDEMKKVKGGWSLRYAVLMYGVLDLL